MKINAKKARIGLSKVTYLGYTLSTSKYSLEEYIIKETARKYSKNNNQERIAENGRSVECL